MNLTTEEIQALEAMYLEHSGVSGMRWGQRRYQNPDGSLTALGRIHYGIGQRKEAKAAAKKAKIIQSGDAKIVLKYRKRLTDEEFDTAMARVAKTEALRSKERAEKEAKQRAKSEAKAAKEQIKLRKEQLDNAKKIAKIEAKTKVKEKDAKSLLAKGAAAAVAIAGGYKKYKDVANMISELTGAKIPGVNKTTIFDVFGSSDKKGNNTSSKNSSKTKNNAKAPESRAEGISFTEKKSETSNKAFDDISDAAWDMGKKAYNEFKNTSTTSDTFSSFVEGIGRSSSNSGKEHRTSDHNFWDGVSEIIDVDWTEVKSTPVSDILALPYNDKWLK